MKSRSLPPLLEAAARCRGTTRLIDDSGVHTFDQLWDMSARVSSMLLESAGDLGGQRVAFLVPPSFEYVSVQWGIWRAGGVAVPLGLSHPQPELEYVLDDAEVSSIIVHPQWQDRLAESVSARSIRLMTTDQFVAAEPPAASQLIDIDADRRAMILYTSGSTGRPKGVVTTHRNIMAQVDTLVEAWQWQSADHILHVLPLHHVHGIINVLCCALRVGAVCEFLPKFDPVRVWQRFSDGDLTLFMAVPTIYSKLITAWQEAAPQQQRAWSEGAGKMRLMVSGSAALPVPTLERWEQITGQRLLERYGMTEIGMALSNPLDGQRRPGHVGTPLPGVGVRRTDAQGNLVDDATPGEIEVRGPSVFREYWRREEETRAAFRDGWFRTGDIAVVDEGAYRILGRSSVDIIKTGGYKVSALEIEDVLRTHDRILDCAVVGVPDEQWGERVAVCAVCGPGEPLELAPLRRWCKARLAEYKVPTLLRVCGELPRNAMGKVQKPLVRELFQQE